jgi:hypothetical protein
LIRLHTHGGLTWFEQQWKEQAAALNPKPGTMVITPVVSVTEAARDLAEWQKAATDFGSRLPMKPFKPEPPVAVQPTDVCPNCNVAIVSRYASRWRCNACEASGE